MSQGLPLSTKGKWRRDHATTDSQWSTNHAVLLRLGACLSSSSRGQRCQSRTAAAIVSPEPDRCSGRGCGPARGDVINLPGALQDRLAQLANRPHTYLPLQVFAEADGASQLFQYYLLDTTGFEPNVFTTIFPGVNDHVQLTVTGANCGLPTVGAVRLVLEPKPGLPTDPNNPRAFNDVFTDISPLFVINNESGWYEGWM